MICKELLYFGNVTAVTQIRQSEGLQSLDTLKCMESLENFTWSTDSYWTLC